MFSRRNKHNFSALEGVFGVFMLLLGIIALANSENSGVKLLGNSPITELNSSISSLFIFAYNLVYHTNVASDTYN